MKRNLEDDEISLKLKYQLLREKKVIFENFKKVFEMNIKIE